MSSQTLEIITTRDLRRPERLDAVLAALGEVGLESTLFSGQPAGSEASMARAQRRWRRGLLRISGDGFAVEVDTRSEEVESAEDRPEAIDGEVEFNRLLLSARHGVLPEVWHALAMLGEAVDAAFGWIRPGAMVGIEEDAEPDAEALELATSTLGRGIPGVTPMMYLGTAYVASIGADAGQRLAECVPGAQLETLPSGAWLWHAAGAITVDDLEEVKMAIGLALFEDPRVDPRRADPESLPETPTLPDFDLSELYPVDDGGVFGAADFECEHSALHVEAPLERLVEALPEVLGSPSERAFSGTGGGRDMLQAAVNATWASGGLCALCYRSSDSAWSQLLFWPEAATEALAAALSEKLQARVAAFVCSDEQGRYGYALAEAGQIAELVDLAALNPEGDPERPRSRGIGEADLDADEVSEAIDERLTAAQIFDPMRGLDGVLELLDDDPGLALSLLRFPQLEQVELEAPPVAQAEVEAEPEPESAPEPAVEPESDPAAPPAPVEIQSLDDDGLNWPDDLFAAHEGRSEFEHDGHRFRSADPGLLPIRAAAVLGARTTELRHAGFGMLGDFTCDRWPARFVRAFAHQRSEVAALLEVEATEAEDTIDDGLPVSIFLSYLQRIDGEAFERIDAEALTLGDAAEAVIGDIETLWTALAASEAAG